MKDDPGLRGMETFFAPRVIRITGAAELKSGAPDSNSGAPESNNGAPELEVAPAQPISDPPEINVAIVRRNIRHAYTAQDGHSRAENDLYAAMYKSGTPIEGGTRRLVMGTRTLAQRAGMAYSTCQSNLESLEEKLAIKCEGDAKPRQLGKVWLVYSFVEILHRRRQAGLTHYVKTTKGVKLISAPALEFGAPDLKSGAPNAGAPDFCKHAPELISGAPNAGALLETDDAERKEKSSSSLDLLVSVCHNTGLTFDDDAARRLLADCRKKDPNATIEEVAHFLGVKLQQFRSKRNVENPVGLLIHSVPKYFEPPANELKQVREIWRRQDQYT